MAELVAETTVADVAVQGEQQEQTTSQEGAIEQTATGAEQPGEAHKDELPAWMKAYISKEKAAREAAEARAAEAERRAGQALDVATRSVQQPATAKAGPPKAEDFADEAEYHAAVIDYRVEQKLEAKLAEREQRQAQQTAAQAFQSSVIAAREKYADYDTVITGSRVGISDAMKEALFASPQAGDLLYHLARNPAEAERISQLRPIAAARELGRLEVTLANSTTSAATPARTTTAAKPLPPPVRPVSASATTAKSLEDMPFGEYVAQRRAQEAARR